MGHSWKKTHLEVLLITQPKRGMDAVVGKCEPESI